MKWKLLAASALVTFGLLHFSPGQAQSAATVSLPSISLPDGLTTKAKLSISGIQGTGLSDFQGRLNFNGTVAQVSRVDGLNGYTVFASAIDNQVGEVRFVVAKTSAPFLQQGDVLEFTFTAVGQINASTSLALSLTTFNDSNGVFIPHTMSEGRITIIARQPLTANFSVSPAQPVINQTVQFTDQTPLTEGVALVQWNWNFGDGTTSTVQNPTHVYTQPGTFTVELTVTDNFQRSNTFTKQLTVLQSAPTETGRVVVHVYPQPAETEATIVYQTPASAQNVSLFIFSATGKQVYHNEALDVQAGRFTWDLRGLDDKPVPNGAYFFVVVAFDKDGRGVGRGTGSLIVQR